MFVSRKHDICSVRVSYLLLFGLHLLVRAGLSGESYSKRARGTSVSKEFSLCSRNGNVRMGGMKKGRTTGRKGKGG